MTAVSLVSFSGAPGTTTTAVATAAALATTGAPEPVLVELATSGGVVAGWYDLPTEPGLTSLALALGEQPPDLLAHAQALPGGLPAVVAPASGSRITTLLAARSQALAAYLRSVSATVVVDCGRVSVDSPVRAVLEASTLVGVVIRPDREAFRLAATALAELNTVASRPLPVGWVIIGSSPWPIDDIITQYGFPVLATIAEDRTGADAVAGRRRLRRHAPLARSAQSFADDITKHLRVASAEDPLAYLHDDRLVVGGGAATAEAPPDPTPAAAASVDPAPPDPVPADPVPGAPAPPDPTPTPAPVDEGRAPVEAEGRAS